MAPVVKQLQRATWAESVLVVTGQHREMLDQVLAIFDLRPDADLDLMRPGQVLTDLGGRALAIIGEVVRRYRPDLFLVQGDTTSALVGALAAFYENVPVAHVEAGLRSFERYDPYPEEVNRRLISVVAELHFAPTERARRNLLAEGVDDAKIVVTGNTVVDALRTAHESLEVEALPEPPGFVDGGRLILVTLHRRESWGEPMASVCQGLRLILDQYPSVHLLFPMHRNPIVREVVVSALGNHPRAHLVEPMDYVAFVKAMSRCYLIVTDSGGIQEEAPTFGKPVLVVRETTERPEAIEAGAARLIGTMSADVFRAIAELLGNAAAYRQMAQPTSPFGDGRASERIVQSIENWAGQVTRCSDRDTIRFADRSTRQIRKTALPTDARVKTV